MAEFAFPSVSPIPFVKVEGVWWDSGKPRCTKHRGCCVVRADLLGKPCQTDGGTHVCPACMREAYEAHKATEVQP